MKDRKGRKILEYVKNPSIPYSKFTIRTLVYNLITLSLSLSGIKITHYLEKEITEEFTYQQYRLQN